MSGKFPTKILVATDFSEVSKLALRQAVAIKEKNGAELTLVHALEDLKGALERLPTESRWKLVSGNIDEFENDLRAKTNQKLAEFLKSEQIQGVTTKTLVGKAAIELVHEVHAGGYDLVVAGTVGTTAMRRFFMGSVAEQLLRTCPCAVWVTRPENVVSPRKILVPVDFSEVTERIVENAGAIAKLFGSEIILLHTFDSEVLSVLGVLDGDSSENLALLAKNMEEEVGPKLDELKKLLPAEVKVVTKILRGDAATVINELQEPDDVDLTIMGTVGRSGMSGLLLGNTAEKVLRHSYSSLLVVKPANFVSPIGPPLVR